MQARTWAAYRAVRSLLSREDSYFLFPSEGKGRLSAPGVGAGGRVQAGRRSCPATLATRAGEDAGTTSALKRTQWESTTHTATAAPKDEAP